LSFQADDGTVVPSSEVRRLLRAGKSSGKSTGGRHLVISEDLENLVDPLFADLDLRQENGRYLASARSGEIVREIRGRIAKSQTVGQAPIVFPFTQPASLHAELRPYQRLGAAWLLDRVTRFGGALLADDMGLGKTLQAIALIECLLSEPASEMELILVIATASLLGNWRAEFARFAPARRVHVLHGAGRDAARDRLVAGDVILTSYGTLARDLAWHLRRDYRAVVVDEASLMRNPDTDHAKAIAKLHACHRIALTGTPVENGVRDLWSVFRFIQPGWLGGREEFRDRYELPLAGGESAAGVMERLKLKTHPFLLRRTKEQVAPELPTKLFIDEFCDLSPDQQTVYHELLLEGRRRVDAIADSGNPAAARMQLLTALLRLRQTCCDLALFSSERFNRLLVARRSAKLHRLLELLEEAVSGNHRVLVFSQFQKQLVEIEKCVVEREWGCLRLDGQTRNRHQMVEAFQQPNGPPVFLISLKAGGYGLNLTAADTVIHFDPWWNPAAEMQATDRAHRIGQTRPVTVYRLLTRGTVEEKVIRMQARKRELAASIDESGTGDAVGWNMEDLKAVIAGD
jgi:SNF2 family DNA or RNA helicase